MAAHPTSISKTFSQNDLGLLPATPLVQPNGTAIPASTPILGQVNFWPMPTRAETYPQNTYRLLGPPGLRHEFKYADVSRIGQESQDQFPGPQFYGPYPQYDVGGTVSNLSALYSLSHSFSPAHLQQ